MRSLGLFVLFSVLVPAISSAEERFPVYTSDLTLLRQISASLRAENEKLSTELESSRVNSGQLSKMLDLSEKKIKAYDEQLASVEDRLSKSKILATEALQALTEAKDSLTNSIQSLTRLKAELRQMESDWWTRAIYAVIIALGLGWAIGHYL